MAFLKFNIHTDGLDKIADKLAQACTKEEHVLAQQIKSDTEKYVPSLSSSLKDNTRVVNSSIIYPGPYSNYLYRGKVMVDSVTGKGPMRFIDSMGNEKIRFRKGANLKPTDRDLKLAHASDPDAQDHWFEVSKAQNLDKWIRISKKDISNDIDK